MNIVVKICGRWEVVSIRVDFNPLLGQLAAPDSNSNGNGHRPMHDLCLRASGWWTRQTLQP